jgi:processive 1,2-diacylglycerol beta-glucosyltransferase
MKKVLILTAGFGEGHNAAARNLRDALELVSDEVKVEVLDLFESSYGSFNTLAKSAYLNMVQYAPKLLGRRLLAAGQFQIRRKPPWRPYAA